MQRQKIYVVAERINEEYGDEEDHRYTNAYFGGTREAALVDFLIYNISTYNGQQWTEYMPTFSPLLEFCDGRVMIPPEENSVLTNAIIQLVMSHSVDVLVREWNTESESIDDCPHIDIYETDVLYLSLGRNTKSATKTK